MSTDESVFAGFEPPIKNFFSLPNEMTNVIAHITNLAELKVILYVMRHTWGFHEYGICKAITTDEFMHGRKRADGTRMDEGTGLSNRSVIDGLRAAVEHGYLICKVDTSDQARVVKSYALKMAESDVKNVHTYEESSQGEEYSLGYEKSSHLAEGSSYRAEEPSHRSEKDTKERHLKKDTQEKQKSVSANGHHPQEATPSVVATLSPVSLENKTHSQNGSSLAISSEEPLPIQKPVLIDKDGLQKPLTEKKDPPQRKKSGKAREGEEDEDEAALARRRGIYERIVKRRGYELNGKAIIHERLCIKQLAELYTDAQIEAIHKYLFERDWKWSKVDNKFTIGASTLLQEGPRVAQILKEERLGTAKGGEATPEEQKPRPLMFVAGSGPQTPLNLPVAPRKSQVKKGIIQ